MTKKSKTLGNRSVNREKIDTLELMRLRTVEVSLWILSPILLELVPIPELVKLYESRFFDFFVIFLIFFSWSNLPSKIVRDFYHFNFTTYRAGSLILECLFFLYFFSFRLLFPNVLDFFVIFSHIFSWSNFLSKIVRDYYHFILQDLGSLIVEW